VVSLTPLPQSVATVLRALCEVVVARRAQPSRQPASRPACLAEADQRLALHGWPQASAYRVYSAGDSCCGREEILFVAREGDPFTARLGTVVAAGRRIEWLEVEAGW
jgi:hypothetical protein